MDNEQALQLIQSSLSSIWRSGLVEKEIIADPNTVLLGTGSELDSMAFVTLMTDLEERLSSQTGQEIFLVMTDILDYNSNEDAYLTVQVLAGYLVSLSK